ncbi:hypothetical protein V7034_16005 [Priestia megaterium]
MLNVDFICFVPIAVDWRAKRSLARKSTAVSQADQLMYPICSSLN